MKCIKVKWIVVKFNVFDCRICSSFVVWNLFKVKWKGFSGVQCNTGPCSVLNVSHNSVELSEVQCGGVQCRQKLTAVVCRAVQCSAVQCSEVQCGGVQCRLQFTADVCRAVQYNHCIEVNNSTLPCSAVQCSALNLIAIQYSTVQYSAMPCRAVQCSMM